VPKSRTVERILIIEDEEIARELMATLLRQQGYQVIEAIDGMSGLVAARNEHPDLAVLDLNLPDISGVDVATLLQDQVPFIVLTVDRSEQSLTACIERGALGYSVKPLMAEDFLRQVRIALKRGKERGHLRRALNETQRINKALGILMGHGRLTEDAAYRALVKQATARRIKVAALAEQLLKVFQQTVPPAGDNESLSSCIEQLLGETEPPD
jgi:AmiR/NasT family two-component response regulator